LLSKCNDVKQQVSIEATEHSMYQTKCQTKYQTKCQPTTKTSTPATPPANFEEAKQAAHKKGKPFCKVCFDAGKPESSYTSHYVKSAPGPTGKLVCPTLLNQSCLTCGHTGHTSGYCTQNQNQRQNPVVLSRNVSSVISAEAELRLMSATFKPKHDDFPSLMQQSQEDQEPVHVYNPKSNAFGALAQKQPKQFNQKSFQPPQQPQQSQQSQQPEARPMTMAERLKTPPAKVAPVAPAPVAATAVKVKFADMPPKSQFWWQDED
jgi:hypothetical protein